MAKIKMLSTPIGAYVNVYNFDSTRKKKRVCINGVTEETSRVRLIVYEGKPWRFNLERKGDIIQFRSSSTGVFTFPEIDSDDWMPAEEGLPPTSDYIAVGDAYVEIRRVQ